MIGIYQITNKINNKIYIGQSVNIKERYAQHIRNSTNKNTHTYNYPLSRAFRKYGSDNFELIVLEECSIDELTKKEQYWIDYMKRQTILYNQELAIDAKRGEKSNFAILKEEQVNQIKLLLKNTHILMSEIGETYGVSGSAIQDINKGRRWATDIEYPIRRNNTSIAHRGQRQNKAQLSEKEVINIRERFVYEDIKSIYQDYRNIIGFSGFKKIIYGASWKHLPIYKKYQKIWVLPD